MGKDNMSESGSSFRCSAHKVLAKAAIAAAALLLPAMAWAQDEYVPAADNLTLAPVIQSRTTEASQATSTDAPFFLDAVAPAAEQPNIHGFANITFTTAYLTPRGLLVVKDGLVIQPIVGLVFPIGDLGPLKNYTVVTGVWNNIAASQGDPGVGGWNEMDYFFSQSGTVADVFNLTLSFGEWNFPTSVAPPNKPKAEYELDLNVTYDDSKLWGDSGFSLNPYVDIWYSLAGSSNVVLGRKGGGTGYVPTIKTHKKL
jgi:hypothetical protein